MKAQTYNKNFTFLDTESIAEHWQNKERFNLGLPAPLNRKNTLFFFTAGMPCMLSYMR
jgi:hypothetical protein